MRVAGLHQLKRPLTKLANPCASGGSMPWDKGIQTATGPPAISRGSTAERIGIECSTSSIYYGEDLPVMITS
jgi:hypothetical protein